MIPQLFAEATTQLPDPSGYAAVGWVLFALLGIGGAVLMGMKLFRRDPPLHKEFMPRNECERTHGDLQKVHTEIKEELKRHSASRKGLYEKLEGHSKQISEVGGVLAKHGSEMEGIREELADTNRRIDDLNNRIDAIPGRVISLLRETKNLI